MLEQYLQVKPVQTSHDRNSHLRKQKTFFMTIFATNFKKLVQVQNIFPKKHGISRTQIEKICAKQEGVLLRLQFLGALDTRIWKNAVYRKKRLFERRKNNFQASIAEFKIQKLTDCTRSKRLRTTKKSTAWWKPHASYPEVKKKWAQIFQRIYKDYMLF